jgi:hypothetical protein
VIKLGDIIWMGHIALIGNVINAYRNSDEKLPYYARLGV